MAQGKGGVYGSFVMVRLKQGNSMQYPMDEAKKKTSKATVTSATGGKSTKCPVTKMKEPVAKYFGFEIIIPKDMVLLATKEVTTKINGKEQKINKLVSMGSTGASRSITVVFKALQTIGGKQVASVKIPMPSSHTFGNMVQELMEGTKSNSIAQIISPAGKAMTFGTSYSSTKKKRANNAATTAK
jgi:DNA-binding protein YbaB